MFETARGLVLKDRAKARKALTDEIKRSERDEIDAELDQLAQEERERLAQEEADAQRAQRAAQAHEDLQKVRADQLAAAKAFDDAVADANRAFGRLEDLATEAARLEREAGVGDGQRPSIVGHARTGALVAAMWHYARPLAKRLGLRAVPGTSRNIRPLATIYQTNAKEKT